jgi:hypothetical protein
MTGTTDVPAEAILVIAAKYQARDYPGAVVSEGGPEAPYVADVRDVLAAAAEAGWVLVPEPAGPEYRPGQLLGARHDDPDPTGALTGSETIPPVGSTQDGETT